MVAGLRLIRHTVLCPRVEQGTLYTAYLLSTTGERCGDLCHSRLELYK